MNEDIEDKVGPLLDAVSILGFSGKGEPAIELLQRAVNEHPDNEYIVAMAILNCLCLGKFDEARRFHQRFQEATGKPVESFNASVKEIEMAESEWKELRADFLRSRRIVLRSFPLFWISTILEAQDDGLWIKKGGRDSLIPWKGVQARISLNATFFDHVDREITLATKEGEISFKADLSTDGKECHFYEFIHPRITVFDEDKIQLSFGTTTEKDKLVVSYLKEFVALQMTPNK